MRHQHDSGPLSAGMFGSRCLAYTVGNAAYNYYDDGNRYGNSKEDKDRAQSY